MYAHSVENQPPSSWEPLAHHLKQVGERAGVFGQAFGAALPAQIMGALHDIGKCAEAYQRYIRAPRVLEGQVRGPDHSTAGAQVASRLFGKTMGRLMAFGIAGHHGGLIDGCDLTKREAKLVEDYAGWETHAPPLPDPTVLLASLKTLRRNAVEPAFSLFFLGRMLFSCLVDADFLETEHFYAAAAGLPPPARGGRLELRHRDAVRAFMDRHRRDDPPVNQLRSRVLDHAVGKAAVAPGLFTLTVPTGGGKTLTSLSFALEHAMAHGLERIVYVIPFTSIIEQTADVFRTALGDELAGAVLEHHSSFDWDDRAPASDGDVEEEGRSGVAKLRRDAENWDVPIVVTTAVQFFESLFAARTSRARKLHNLANSVIVIDEAQSIPVHLLRPCMAAIDELAKNYGASVVLCTATQPALRVQDGALPRRREGDPAEGLDIPPDRELAPDPAGLYTALRRVAVTWLQQPVPDTAVIARFAEQSQMLCIVNSRGHARTLFDAIADQPGARHLTTLMCAKHRREVLAELRSDLTAGRPVRLVATSLIEAGVDVSFPEVWRAAAGLSSIAQAAGRCNRGGELAGLGRTVVFEPDGYRMPPAINAFYTPAREALRIHAGDPLALAAIEHYYRALYWHQGYAALDRATGMGQAYAILPAVRIGMDPRGVDFPFRTISDAFRLIDEVMDPVLIPHDVEAEGALDALLHAPVPPAGILRKLQQYAVPVPKKVRATMLASGVARVVREDYGDRFVVLQDPERYDRLRGLNIDDALWRSSEQNML